MKVVSNLTRLQFVVAQRGPGGGIKLNRSPEDIGLNEVISNTEKHLQQTDVPVQVELTATTRLSSFLQLALNAYLEALGHYTLADVLGAESEVVSLLSLNDKAA